MCCADQAAARFVSLVSLVPYRASIDPVVCFVVVCRRRTWWRRGRTRGRCTCGTSRSTSSSSTAQVHHTQHTESSSLAASRPAVVRGALLPRAPLSTHTAPSLISFPFLAVGRWTGSVKGGAGSLLASRPLQSFKGHRDEGFALDWSNVSQGSLVTGDNTGVIHNWTVRGWKRGREEAEGRGRRRRLMSWLRVYVYIIIFIYCVWCVWCFRVWRAGGGRWMPRRGSVGTAGPSRTCNGAPPRHQVPPLNTP